MTKSPLYGERNIKDSELICFDNPNNTRPYKVFIELPEFTCKCPFSGYPDFAVIRVTYTPKYKVLELKSLKLYINSYRDLKISHEEVANKILDDFIHACSPKYMKIEADFNPRGNVKMIVEVDYEEKGEK